MTINAMQNLITSTITTYGGALVTILTAVIGIGVAYLVFRFGWHKVKTSTGEHHVKSDLNMYHYSEDYMKARGIKPYGISKFDEGRF